VLLEVIRLLVQLGVGERVVLDDPAVAAERLEERRFFAATGPIRNIVNGMCAAAITLRSLDCCTKPSSIVRNATFCVVGIR